MHIFCGNFLWKTFVEKSVDNVEKSNKIPAFSNKIPGRLRDKALHTMVNKPCFCRLQRNYVADFLREKKGQIRSKS